MGCWCGSGLASWAVGRVVEREAMAGGADAARRSRPLGRWFRGSGRWKFSVFRSAVADLWMVDVSMHGTRLSFSLAGGLGGQQG